jgi:hypothetical protein
VATVVLAVIGCIAPAASAGTRVAININTGTSSPLAAGFSGFNTPQLRNGVEYYDPKFVAAVMPLKPGWLRFPAGTGSMAYDWNPQDASGGHIDIAWMNSLIDGNPPLVTGQPANILEASQPLTQAKGGVWLSDFATFANTFDAAAVICFNGFTDTNPGSATLMAQAARSLGLNVVEWELANEAYRLPGRIHCAMSVVPNVKAVGVNSLYTDNYDYHGVIQSVDDYESYLLSQVAANPNFSTDTATDPNTQFQFYTSAPGLALEVANQAINSSTAIWPTTVTGGPFVPTLGYGGQPMPAVYAQGYMGSNGSHYVLITNKSSSTCTTTIQMNGKGVTGKMSITTVSHASAWWGTQRRRPILYRSRPPRRPIPFPSDRIA